jgi:hypothetical protein
MLITVLCCGIDSPGWTGSQDITDLVVVVVGPADGGTFLGKGRRKRETRRATATGSSGEAGSILCWLVDDPTAFLYGP